MCDVWCSKAGQLDDHTLTGSIESNHRAQADSQYYFHSLNQEPFQELFLTHVPVKSKGVFEIR